MKKTIISFILCFMLAQVNFSAEALRNLNLRQKIGDLVKGRKSNEGTKSLDRVISSIKGLGSSLISSGRSQFEYITSKYLNSSSDLTFLTAYSVFAKSSGEFFSLLEPLLTKIRTEYATSLGAQNRINNATNAQTIQKQENKDELSKNNIQRCLDILTGNEFNVLKANLQSSGIILLTVMQKEVGMQAANEQMIKNQVAALIKKCNWEIDGTMSTNLEEGLAAAIDMEVTQWDDDLRRKIVSLIEHMFLFRDILVKIQGYVQNGDNSGIDKILNDMEYYANRGYGNRNDIGYYSGNDEYDGRTLYGDIEDEGYYLGDNGDDEYSDDDQDY